MEKKMSKEKIDRMNLLRDQKVEKEKIIQMNLHQRLLKVKEQLEYIKKDAPKSQGDKESFAHVTSTNVLLRVNPLLNKYGILLIPEIKETKYGMVTIDFASSPPLDPANTKVNRWVFNLVMTMTWVNVDDPIDKIECEWSGAGENGLERGLGSALTYAEKFFMLKFFNIPTDEYDPDKIANRQARVKKEISRSDDLGDKMLPDAKK